MDANHNLLRCLLITVQNGQVLLPSSLVVEVLPFATPLHLESAPPWVVGAMLWHNLTTPLISLGRLVFEVAPHADLNTRVIIVNTLGSDAHLPHFGILGTAAPRPVNLERHEIQAITESLPAQQLGVLAWGRYEEQTVLIPDLDAIEAVLQPLVHRN